MDIGDYSMEILLMKEAVYGTVVAAPLSHMGLWHEIHCNNADVIVWFLVVLG